MRQFFSLSLSSFFSFSLSFIFYSLKERKRKIEEDEIPWMEFLYQGKNVTVMSWWTERKKETERKRRRGQLTRKDGNFFHHLIKVSFCLSFSSFIPLSLSHSLCLSLSHSLFLSLSHSLFLSLSLSLFLVFSEQNFLLHTLHRKLHEKCKF